MDPLIFILTLLAFLFAVITISLSLFLIVIKLIKKDTYSLITFLGNYKKGVFSLTYIAVFFIQLANSLFTNNTLTISGIYNVINNTINAFVLSVDFDALTKLIEKSTFYALSVKAVYIIVIINLCLFIISLCLPFILRFIKAMKIKRKNNCVIFVGYNDKTNDIIKSMNKKYSFILIDSFSSEDKLKLMKHVYYFSNINDNFEGLNLKLSKLIKKFKIKNTYIIIDKNSNDNLIITKEVSDLIQKFELENNQFNVNAYILGDDTNKDAFLYYVKKSMGRIHYVNKYQLISFDFINKFPLTNFMNSNQLDYENGLVKEDINLNVYLIGFGNVNKHLLSSMIANNQFIYKDKNGNLKDKLVNYYIYDKNEKLEDKNLNHYLNRFINELFDENKKYLSKDLKISEIFLRQTQDINNKDFYLRLYDDIKNTKPNDLNYLIISIGDEIENIDLTFKLLAKINEWNITSTTKVFCRVQNSKYLDYESLKQNKLEYLETNDSISIKMFGNEVSEKQITTKNNTKDLFYPFAMEDKLIYQLDNILNNQVEQMAKYRNFVYYLEYNKKSSKNQNLIDNNTFNSLYQDSIRSWYYDSTQIQRDSNIYVLYNLRTKLQLLGFDYINKNDSYDENKYDLASFDEFNSVYLKGSILRESFQMTYIHNNQTITKPFKESDEFFEGTTRWNMAYQEHARWNAYHICQGVMPSSIDDILSDINNGKDLVGKRMHPNVTSFEGLKKYAKIIAVKNYLTDIIKKELNSQDIDKTNIKYLSQKIASNEISKNYDQIEQEFEKLDSVVKTQYLNDSDVIKYDFQILDDLEWFFTTNDLILLKRKF